MATMNKMETEIPLVKHVAYHIVLQTMAEGNVTEYKFSNSEKVGPITQAAKSTIARKGMKYRSTFQWDNLER